MPCATSGGGGCCEGGGGGSAGRGAWLACMRAAEGWLGWKSSVQTMRMAIRCFRSHPYAVPAQKVRKMKQESVSSIFVDSIVHQPTKLFTQVHSPLMYHRLFFITGFHSERQWNKLHILKAEAPNWNQKRCSTKKVKLPSKKKVP